MSSFCQRYILLLWTSMNTSSSIVPWYRDTRTYEIGVCTLCVELSAYKQRYLLVPVHTSMSYVQYGRERTGVCKSQVRCLKTLMFSSSQGIRHTFLTENCQPIELVRKFLAVEDYGWGLSVRDGEFLLGCKGMTYWAESLDWRQTRKRIVQVWTCQDDVSRISDTPEYKHFSISRFAVEDFHCSHHSDCRSYLLY